MPQCRQSSSPDTCRSDQRGIRPFFLQNIAEPCTPIYETIPEGRSPSAFTQRVPYPFRRSPSLQNDINVGSLGSHPQYAKSVMNASATASALLKQIERRSFVESAFNKDFRSDQPGMYRYESIQICTPSESFSPSYTRTLIISFHFILFSRTPMLAFRNLLS